MMHVRSFQFSSSARHESSDSEEVDDYEIKELRSEDEWHRLGYKNLAMDGEEMVADCLKSNSFSIVEIIYSYNFIF